MWTAVLVLLALLSTLSPLLTYAWLWQLKEWRTDRLREQLQREGVVSTLLGRVRPVAAAVFLIALFLTPARTAVLTATGLFVLSVLSCIPVLQHSQRMPRWTPKALCITGCAMLLNAIGAIAFSLLLPPLLLLLPLLQPVMIALAWAAFLPVDGMLKNRELKHAEDARARFPELTVIGITGSVGKTTTKELIGHLLQDLNPAVTPAYMNAEIGVARWLRRELSSRAADDLRPLVVEMGAYRKGEIAVLCRIAKPTLGVVTAVGDQHIALFGSQQAIAEAKGELIASLPENGHAFLNGDQELVRAMKERARCAVTLAGTGGRLDLEAFDIEETAQGVQFRVDDTLLQLPLRGTHNVTNVLLAVAVARHLGIRMPRIAQLLRSFEPPNRTFSVRTERGVTILDDTHNSSSSSIRAAIAWARSQPQEQKTLVVSGLIELGEHQGPVERELGGQCRGVFERLIVLDPGSRRHFAEGFGGKTELFSTATEGVPAGSLLVCAGRMSASTVSQLLP